MLFFILILIIAAAAALARQIRIVPHQMTYVIELRRKTPMLASGMKAAFLYEN